MLSFLAFLVAWNFILEDLTGQAQQTDKYIVVELVLDYNEAQAHCQREYGTDLASIHSAEDNTAAEELCRSSSSSCWFGLNDKAQEGVFVWEDGTAFDYGNDTSGGVAPWDASSGYGGQPNNCCGGEDCAMFNGGRGYDWTDENCADTAYFICNALPPTTTEPSTSTVAPTSNTPTTDLSPLTTTTQLQTSTPVLSTPQQLTTTPAAINSVTHGGSDSGDTALTIVVIAVVVCVMAGLLFLCYRSWRTQKRNKANANNMRALSQDNLGAPPPAVARSPRFSASTATIAVCAATTQLSVLKRQSTIIAAEGTHATGGAAPLRPNQVNRSAVAVCLAAEHDEVIMGDDDFAEVGSTPQGAPTQQNAESGGHASTLAQLSEQAKNQQESKKADYQRVFEWFVNDVELPQYFNVFINNGYDSIALIGETIDGADALAEIGITAKGHQKKILIEIEKLGQEGC